VLKKTNPDARQKLMDAAIAQARRQFGVGVVMKMDGEAAMEDVVAIPTGSLGLDLALGVGGIPLGRICEIYGPEASGKSTLAMTLVSNAQKMGLTCVYVDAEHALDLSYATALGVKLDDLYLSQPDYGEQALGFVDTMTRSGAADVIVIDSVAALVPKAELDGDIGDASVGVQARMMSQAMRKLVGIAKQNNVLLVFINQLRQKIGMTGYGPSETTTGGNALKYYASVRLDIRRIKTLKVGDRSVGNQTRVKVAKNKVAPPFREAIFDIVYGEGISRESEIIDLGLHFDLIAKSGSWLSYGDGRIGQGKEKAREFLKENRNLAEEIEGRIREAIAAAGGKTPLPAIILDDAA